MAIQEVRERSLRSKAALEAAQVLYAVAAGNAVAEWVGRVDKAAVRFTQDVQSHLNEPVHRRISKSTGR